MKQKSIFSGAPVFLILLVAGGLVYSNSFHNSFHFDDHKAIITNDAIRNFRDWGAIFNAFNSRFLVGLSLAANFAAGGLDTFGYHVFNFLIHSLNAYLVYRLAVLLSETPLLSQASPVGRPAGFIVALLFLLHPVQTQAVNYIWQRAALLVTFFYLASLVFYLRSRMTRSRAYYFLALLAAGLGMLCKEIMITVPATLAMAEFIFFASKDRWTRRAARLLPFLFLCLVIPALLTRTGSLTLDLMKTHSAAPQGFFDIDHLTRGESEFVMPRHTYYGTQLNVLWTYFRLFFLPLSQNIDYDYPLSRSFFEFKTFLSFLGIASLLAAGIVFLKKHRLLCFCILWFFAAVSVEFLVPQADVIMEHRLYLPMAPLALFLAAASAGFLRKNTAALFFAAAVPVFLFSFLTYQRNFIWRDEFTLWNDAVEKSPRKARPYNNRGLAYNQTRQIDLAIQDFEKAAAIDPEYAEFYCNLGIAYDQKNDLEKAIFYYTRALEKKPRYAKVLNNRGVDYQLTRDYEKAISDLTRAVEIKPNYSEAYNNRGISRQLLGRLEEAISDYDKAIRLDPANAQARFNRSVALKAQGNLS